MTTANSDADSGRSSGGQISFLTKGGTNSFHGGAYEYYRPTFAANDWFIKQSQVSNDLPNRPPFLLRNTYGAFVGGPIKKDRLFFFLSFEGIEKARGPVRNSDSSQRRPEKWLREFPSATEPIRTAPPLE